MSEAQKIFLKESEVKAFDLRHRSTLRYNISRYSDAVIQGKKQYAHIETAKQKAAHIKNKVIIDLPKYLIDFEANFQSRGGKVIWAVNADEAVKEILKIAKKAQVKSVVKSKSMVTEEISLNEHLEKAGIEVNETDLGEFIVQQAGQKPYHIVTPAMHLSKEDVAELFTKKFGLKENSTPEEITGWVREHLRDKFQAADIGITGANFLVADTGSVCLTENEGNAMMSFSFPKIHIVIAGIERIIPRLSDLHIFLPLLATFGTGQNITAYNSVISGPKADGEADGPEEMVVILLDNGRTDVLAKKHQRRALTCIHCGACLNVCPVYKLIGGHTYGTTYSGPIGSVITPWLKGMKEYKHLSYASTLCGACTETCPVLINIHELLLYNRNDAVKEKLNGKMERFTFSGFKKVMKSRSLLDKFSGSTKNKVLHKFFASSWGERRTLPEIAPKSFSQLWQEQIK